MKNGSWEIGSAVEDQFIGVQSVVAFENKLYVLTHAVHYLPFCCTSPFVLI
jgi:hypothetical protein